MVMYAGQVAEVGLTRTVFDSPAHLYSEGVMEAFPSIKGPKVPLSGIGGSPPNLARRADGCWFAPRCPKVFDRCRSERPELYPLDNTRVRCFLHDPVRREVAAAAEAARPEPPESVAGF